MAVQSMNLKATVEILFENQSKKTTMSISQIMKLEEK